MKFGSADNPEEIDFTLPKDHPDTKRVLSENKTGLKEVFVGCAKWNKADLKGFYPRGTKDELSYYSQQFNSIELNATFYNFDADQIKIWKDKTPDDFKFFPKVPRYLSHLKRLKDYGSFLDDYLAAISGFDSKFGMAFLQMIDNYGPKDENISRLEKFLNDWPADLPLAVELRHTDWFNDQDIAENLYQLLESKNKANIIVDSAGRRDIMHMRLTDTTAFVRYVGANHSSDYTRLDDWIKRIKEWKQQGLENLYFFIHQNVEKESPLLAVKFIEKLNKEIGTNIKIPDHPGNNSQGKLDL